VRGEVRFDGGTRALYATDSSNYRHPPLGVVYPRDEQDVVAAMEVCAAEEVAVFARGAGTSLAGQACNEAVVLDTSRHLDAIVEIDAASLTAKVQPGVVLDALRAAAGRVGLTFGPDPATHAWCTLGGMAGNNSCGTHGLTTGRTSDNVERLRAVTASGAQLDLGPLDPDAARRAIAAGGETGRIVGALSELIGRYADAVRSGFPRLERRVSGYNLDDLLPERGFHLARALVGTESTCVVLTELTVSLVPLLPFRRVVLLAYEDVFAAADAVPALRRLPLAALEGFDDVLVEHMRAAGLHLANLSLLPPGRGFLLAEVAAEDEAEADQRAKEVLEAAEATTGRRLLRTPEEQAALWKIRESGLGATARPPGRPPNLEGWEDAAVPPERLGAYLRGITELWARHGYGGAWYGHFGQGCVHTRNNFDFSSPEGRANYRSYVEEAARLCVSLGGSLSGEHGDGQARGELLETMFGATLVGAFGEFKAVFDPKGRMNPGRVVHARPLDADLRHGGEHAVVRLGPTKMALLADGGRLEEAVERCVGVGRCRSAGPSGVMCPSFRATGDERHSTRGRAKLFAEMFRGELTPATWRNEDLYDALSLCLSCKGCASDCPTHVDMATYKAEFLFHYYQGRLRPRVDYALALVPFFLRLASRSPRLVNALLGEHRLGRALRKAAGLTTARPAPRLAAQAFRSSTQAREHLAAGEASVVVFTDTFSNAYLPSRAKATISVLEAAGEKVAIAPWSCCGRTLFDTGMLDLATASLRRVLNTLEPYLAAGVPVVVPEPSCLATFRDELGQLLPGDERALRLATLSRSLSEHLDGRLPPGLANVPPGSAGSVAVWPHCHARATGGSLEADRRCLEAAGFRVQVLDAGCCGLAGSFGFRSETESMSRAVAAQGFSPALRALDPSTIVVLDGFSCTTQASQLGLAAGVSLAELLDRQLRSTRA
jgi:FAD/FMN-containing dehydrogenase/Fe-S oxidoreductase